MKFKFIILFLFFTNICSNFNGALSQELQKQHTKNEELASAYSVKIENVDSLPEDMQGAVDQITSESGLQNLQEICSQRKKTMEREAQKLRKDAEQRHSGDEQRKKQAYERHLQAEQRKKQSYERHLQAEQRKKQSYERHLQAEQRKKQSYERHLQAEQRKKQSYERHLQAEQRKKQSYERHLQAEQRKKAAEERAKLERSSDIVRTVPPPITESVPTITNDTNEKETESENKNLCIEIGNNNNKGETSSDIAITVPPPITESVPSITNDTNETEKKLEHGNLHINVGNNINKGGIQKIGPLELLLPIPDLMALSLKKKGNIKWDVGNNVNYGGSQIIGQTETGIIPDMGTSLDTAGEASTSKITSSSSVRSDKDEQESADGYSIKIENVDSLSKICSQWEREVERRAQKLREEVERRRLKAEEEMESENKNLCMEIGNNINKGETSSDIAITVPPPITESVPTITNDTNETEKKLEQENLHIKVGNNINKGGIQKIGPLELLLSIPDLIALSLKKKGDVNLKIGNNANYEPTKSSSPKNTKHKQETRSQKARVVNCTTLK